MGQKSTASTKTMATLEKTSRKPAPAKKPGTTSSKTVSKSEKEKNGPQKTGVRKKSSEKTITSTENKVKTRTSGAKTTSMGTKRSLAAKRVARPRKTTATSTKNTSRPRKSTRVRQKKELSLSESVTQTLNEYLPQIKKHLRETTQSVLKNKEALLITFGAVYFLMPTMIKMIVTREEFTSFCLKNTEALIEPSRLKFS
jgi:hypothetical protein